MTEFYIRTINIYDVFFDDEINKYKFKKRYVGWEDWDQFVLNPAPLDIEEIKNKIYKKEIKNGE